MKASIELQPCCEGCPYFDGVLVDNFAGVTVYGGAVYDAASSSSGVRPLFIVG